MGDDAFDLDLAAATLRANGSDVQVMLRALATQLDGALGDGLEVERAGGLFRRSEEVKAIVVTLGDDTLRAEAHGTGLRCTISHTSGGIRIRSEQVETDAWIRRLLQALATAAESSDTARQALERIVIGGSR